MARRSDTRRRGEKATLFQMGGDHFLPLPVSVSPWHRTSVNGAAIGALLALLVEEGIDHHRSEVARVVVDLRGRVPLKPLRGRTWIERPGDRFRMLGAELSCDDRVVARIQATLIRRAETPCRDSPLAHPRDQAGKEMPLSDGPLGSRIRTQRISGIPLAPGPATLWAAAEVEVVAGVPLSPLVRTVLLADTGSGIGSELDRRQWSFANLDISLHLTRLPLGEWVLIDARMESAGRGNALAVSRMSDEAGPFAFAFQTLFVEPRD